MDSKRAAIVKNERVKPFNRIFGFEIRDGIAVLNNTLYNLKMFSKEAFASYIL